jgi:putative transposase
MSRVHRIFRTPQRSDPGGAPQAWHPHRRHDDQKAPCERGPGPSAKAVGPELVGVPGAQAKGIVASDFLTVETITLKTRMCCSSSNFPRGACIWLASPRTRTPPGSPNRRETSGWERLENVRFLIHDRDSKYSGPFDEVFRTEGARVIRTPIRAPRANAVAERWVRTVRTECLDWTLSPRPTAP